MIRLVLIPQYAKGLPFVLNCVVSFRLGPSPHQCGWVAVPVEHSFQELGLSIFAPLITTEMIAWAISSIRPPDASASFALEASFD